MITRLKPTASLFALTLALVTCAGCCQRVDSNPARPSRVRGWGEAQLDNGIKSAGEFLLHKGESATNADLGIELKEVIPAQSCRGTESSPAKAVIRIYRLADRKDVLEMEMTPGNTRLISFSRVLVNEYHLDTISMRAINTVEGWVWFELLK